MKKGSIVKPSLIQTTRELYQGKYQLVQLISIAYVIITRIN